MSVGYAKRKKGGIYVVQEELKDSFQSICENCRFCKKREGFLWLEERGSCVGGQNFIRECLGGTISKLMEYRHCQKTLEWARRGSKPPFIHSPCPKCHGCKIHSECTLEHYFYDYLIITHSCLRELHLMFSSLSRSCFYGTFSFLSMHTAYDVS